MLLVFLVWSKQVWMVRRSDSYFKWLWFLWLRIEKLIINIFLFFSSYFSLDSVVSLSVFFIQFFGMSRFVIFHNIASPSLLTSSAEGFTIVLISSTFVCCLTFTGFFICKFFLTLPCGGLQKPGQGMLPIGILLQGLSLILILKERKRLWPTSMTWKMMLIIRS